MLIRRWFYRVINTTLGADPAFVLVAVAGALAVAGGIAVIQNWSTVVGVANAVARWL